MQRALCFALFTVLVAGVCFAQTKKASGNSKPSVRQELSPAPVRATAPGLAYQLGALITSWNGKAQALAAEKTGNYPLVLAVTVIVVALALAGLAMMGREAKGREMTAV